MIKSLVVGLFSVSLVAAAEDNSRPFKDDSDAKFWLQNMVVHHRFTLEEVRAATGLPTNEIAAAIKHLDIGKDSITPGKEIPIVLPYPGGRHPRIGFLEGAIEPQRETKLSIFLPWDPSSYIVADIPEAIWSNLGLTYLAHTHVPTLWSQQKIELPRLEWKRLPNQNYSLERTLPNGIVFGTEVNPGRDGIRMRQWLRNGTDKKLTDLRVQNCIMLKGATNFNAQTNANKMFAAPYCAVKSDSGDRWIITGWSPTHRAWGNAPVPCLHADPKFPDCESNQTVEVKGWLSFYEGKDIQAELHRLDGIGWK